MPRSLDYLIPPTFRSENGQHRHATWTELFYDLVYVVTIARVTDYLREHLSLGGFFGFLMLFMAIWWAWVGYTMYVNRFDTDDVLSRIFTFSQMFLALLIALFVGDAFGESANEFALSYVAVRGVLLILYWRAFKNYKVFRTAGKPLLFGFHADIVFWIVSVYVPGPLKFWLWGIGLAISYLTPLIANRGKNLEQVPIDQSHLPERLGLFTIIVLGESILALISFFGFSLGGSDLWRLLVGFVLLVSVWWLYFEYLETLVVEKSMPNSGQPLIYGHLPLHLGLVILSVGIGKILTGGYPLSIVGLLLSGGLVLFLISLNLIEASNCTRVQKGFFVPVFTFSGLIGILWVFHSFLNEVFYLTGIVVIFLAHVIFMYQKYLLPLNRMKL